MRASRCARPRRAVAHTFRESRYRNDRFVQRLFFSEFTKPRLCGCRRSPQLITDPHPWHAPASGVGQLVIAMASRRARNGATAVVATTACFGMLAYYLRENPARGDADHLVGQAKTDSEVTTPSEIRRVTRDELHAAGFFTSFGFVAASVVVLELASGGGVSRDLKWRTLVGWVAGNHILFAVHSVLGTGETAPKGQKNSSSKDTDGVGKMLTLSNRPALTQLFDEHRLADVFVHAGAVVAGGFSMERVDSLVSLIEHLRRYAEIRPETWTTLTVSKKNKKRNKWNDALAFWTETAERNVFSFSRRKGASSQRRDKHKSAMSVADVVDVFAHTRTAIKVLSPGEIALSLLLAETIRRALRLDLIKHHRHTWADARLAMREGELSILKEREKDVQKRS